MNKVILVSGLLLCLSSAVAQDSTQSSLESETSKLADTAALEISKESLLDATSSFVHYWNKKGVDANKKSFALERLTLALARYSMSAIEFGTLSEAVSQSAEQIGSLKGIDDGVSKSIGDLAKLAKSAASGDTESSRKTLRKFATAMLKGKKLDSPAGGTPEEPGTPAAIADVVRIATVINDIAMGEGSPEKAKKILEKAAEFENALNKLSDSDSSVLQKTNQYIGPVLSAAAAIAESKELADGWDDMDDMERVSGVLGALAKVMVAAQPFLTAPAIAQKMTVLVVVTILKEVVDLNISMAGGGSDGGPLKPKGGSGNKPPTGEKQVKNGSDFKTAKAAKAEASTTNKPVKEILQRRFSEAGLSDAEEIAAIYAEGLARNLSLEQLSQAYAESKGNPEVLSEKIGAMKPIVK